MTDPFTTYDDRDVADLIGQYPLAFVCARNGGATETSLLPLLAECDEQGRLTSFLGHMGRRSALCRALMDDPRALILFLGPHAYVSPGDAGKRDWAPTWNYAQLSIDADILFLADETAASVEILTEVMERDRPEPWDVSALGPRYQKLLPAIIAFRATVTAAHGKFKLGQDETPEIFDSIIGSIDNPALIAWMQRFTPGRD
jgi:transcriptional regulator